jgi:Gas vesicle protein
LPAAVRLSEESRLPEFVSPTRTHGLVDILDRVLDKGLVVAGDIKINLANVELLTIQIRLLVCSIDKAEQIGLNWWRADPRLAASAAGTLPAGELESRLDRIERQLERLGAAGGESPRPPRKPRT